MSVEDEVESVYHGRVNVLRIMEVDHEEDAEEDEEHRDQPACPFHTLRNKSLITGT